MNKSYYHAYLETWCFCSRGWKGSGNYVINALEKAYFHIDRGWYIQRLDGHTTFSHSAAGPQHKGLPSHFDDVGKVQASRFTPPPPIVSPPAISVGSSSFVKISSFSSVISSMVDLVYWFVASLFVLPWILDWFRCLTCQCPDIILCCIVCWVGLLYVFVQFWCGFIFFLAWKLIFFWNVSN